MVYPIVVFFLHGYGFPGVDSNGVPAGNPRCFPLSPVLTGHQDGGMKPCDATESCIALRSLGKKKKNNNNTYIDYL